MSERKVISKYIPQDKSSLPRSLVSSGKKKKKNNQTKVRMMAPMTLRCTSCGAYAFQGTKFNSRKEVVQGEKYLNIPILRFYQRCKVCGSEFTIKTDPKNEAYVAEFGCVASYEPWKEIREKNMVMALDELEQEIENEIGNEESQHDAIKILEQRTAERKRELEMLDRLDDLKTRKDEHNRVDIDELIRKRSEEQNQGPMRNSEEEFSEEERRKLERIKELSRLRQAGIQPSIISQLTSQKPQNTQTAQTTQSESLISNDFSRKRTSDLLENVTLPSVKRASTEESLPQNSIIVNSIVNSIHHSIHDQTSNSRSNDTSIEGISQESSNGESGGQIQGPSPALYQAPNQNSTLVDQKSTPFNQPTNGSNQGIDDILEALSTTDKTSNTSANSTLNSTHGITRNGYHTTIDESYPSFAQSDVTSDPSQTHANATDETNENTEDFSSFFGYESD